MQRWNVSWSLRRRVEPAGQRPGRPPTHEQICPVHHERGRASETTSPRRNLRLDNPHTERELGQADVVECRPEHRRRFVSARALRDHQQFDFHTSIMARKSSYTRSLARQGVRLAKYAPLPRQSAILEFAVSSLPGIKSGL